MLPKIQIRRTLEILLLAIPLAIVPSQASGQGLSVEGKALLDLLRRTPTISQMDSISRMSPDASILQRLYWASARNEYLKLLDQLGNKDGFTWGPQAEEAVRSIMKLVKGYQEVIDSMYGNGDGIAQETEVARFNEFHKDNMGLCHLESDLRTLPANIQQGYTQEKLPEDLKTQIRQNDGLPLAQRKYQP